jgi:hypothetical protein
MEIALAILIPILVLFVILATFWFMYLAVGRYHSDVAAGRRRVGRPS